MHVIPTVWKYVGTFSDHPLQPKRVAAMTTMFPMPLMTLTYWQLSASVFRMYMQYMHACVYPANVISVDDGIQKSFWLLPRSSLNTGTGTCTCMKLDVVQIAKQARSERLV